MTLVCRAVVLLLCAGLHIHSAAVGSADGVADCEISTPSAGADDGLMFITVSWWHNDLGTIKDHTISCNCSVSGYQGSYTNYISCNPSISCSYRILYKKPSCYDECFCDVYSADWIGREWYSNSTCYSGPAAPKAAPIIFPPFLRSSVGNSVQAVFKLPQEDLYCDSINSVSSITVIIRYRNNQSYQYICNQFEVTDLDERFYNFTCQVKHLQFWEPFNFSVSVNNSIGSSPFSNQVTVRGARNDDIARDDYSLHITFNVDLYTLQLYWNLSQKVESMVDGNFITGFQYIIQLLNGNNSITTYCTRSKDLTLNVSLIPNEWYSASGRILTEDVGTWAPEPVYAFFKTPGMESSSSVDKNAKSCKDVMIVMTSIAAFSTLIAVALILIVIRYRYCILKSPEDIQDNVGNTGNKYDNKNEKKHDHDVDHDDDVDHDHHDNDDDDNDDNTSASYKIIRETLGTVVGSYADLRAEPASVVETLHDNYSSSQGNLTDVNSLVLSH